MSDLQGDKDGNYRIMVWGNSGAGKSSLSERLSGILGKDEVKMVDMDALLWNDDWVQTPRPQLLVDIDEATNCPGWVTDGNYFLYHQSYWHKSTDIIWLDFPIYVTFWRCLKRTWTRYWRGDTLFGTNCKESMYMTLFTKESILWWVLTQQRRVRRRFEDRMKEFPELPLRRRFTRTGDVEVWVAQVEAEARERRAKAKADEA